MAETEAAGGEREGRLPGPLLIDGHVHLRAGFGRCAFLDAAAANLRAAASGMGLHRPTGCLLFADAPGDPGFEAMRRLAGREAEGSGGGVPVAGGWRVERTAEEISLIARRADEVALLLVAGRQLVADEGIEVLALGTPGEDAPVGTLSERVRGIVARGGIAVVPWGFGKWWLGRGRVVGALVADSPPAGLLLGDNAGRPAWGWSPSLFRRARRAGVPVLPGSDPLPIARHVVAPGGYGAVLDGDLSAARPGADLVRRLRSAAPGELRPYGRRSGPLRVLRDQAAIRLPGRGSRG